MTPEMMRDALARLAEQEIGVKESGGSNRGPRIQEYQRATWLDGTGWPWCAAFVCWVIREWLKSPVIRQNLGFDEVQAAKWRPQTAGAWDFVNWANDKRLKVVREDEPCRRGDIVVYDFSHIGIVTEDSASGPIKTVEGNTNGEGSRDGDGVYRKKRDRSLVKRFIRVV